MGTFRQLLAQTMAEISEIEPAAAQVAKTAGAIILDVRERDETAQGIVAESVQIVRGMLEATVETQLIDKQTEIIVMCASGVRSAFAAKTLQQLGYTRVSSMQGGYDRWKQEGRPWISSDGLTPNQRNRYSRHILLPEVGEQGQLKLLRSRVLLLGAGGLGSPAALYLAAAGVGTIGIVDMDVVDESNLQRQILHTNDRVGERKVDSAAKALGAINPDISIETFDVRLNAENVLDILADFDVVIDGADNFPSRYLLNDASVKLGIAVVHGSIFRFEGQVTVFDPKAGPTYRDLVPRPPPAELAPNCSEAGVLGVLPGIIGSLQALEAIKLLLGLGDSLVGRLLTFDALEMRFSEYRLEADPENKVTHINRHKIEIADLTGFCEPRLS